MSRRLTNFFGFSLTGSASADTRDSKWENESEHSTSVSTIDTYGERRKSAFSFGLADKIDDDIDLHIRNLYQDPDVLEKKCLYSVKDSKFVDVDSLSLDARRLKGIESTLLSTDHAEKTIDDLGPDYLTPDFDPVRKYVQEVSDLEEGEISEYFMETILEVDENKDIVLGKLSDMIESNYNDLMECMRNVHDIDLDLSRALIQISDGRASIKRASSAIESDSFKICALSTRRDNFMLLLESAKSLKYMKDIFRAVRLNITTGDLGRAAEYIKIVLNGMYNGECKRFKALANIEQETYKEIHTIRQKADNALKRLCGRKFARIEYYNIIRAYMILDDLQENFNLPESAEMNQETCLSSLTSKIQSYHNEDIDHCLHTALFELIVAGHHKKLKAAAQVGSTIPSDMTSLAEAPLYLLYQRIGTDSAAASIMRSCELFADSIYTHYLISKWHSEAVSTNTVMYDGEDPEWTETERSILRGIFDQLCHSRKALWDDVLRGIVEMLNNINITAAVSLDDFLAVIWAIETMIKLGKEFCDVDSFSLLSSIEVKCVEYLQFVHTESFQIVQQLVESDPWDCVPVRIIEYGGLVGILKSKLHTPRNENSLMRLIMRAESIGISGSRSINIQTLSPTVNNNGDSKVETTSITLLDSFDAHGNPFHFLTEDNYEKNSAASPRASKSTILKEITSYMSNVLDDQSLPSKTINQDRSDMKRQSFSSETLVVTQSVVNGLIKYTAKYIQMMHFIPKISLLLWSKLCELFDYYLCYVFTGFVCVEEKNRFLSKPNKMTIPSVYQIRDFEDLYNYLDSKLNAVVEQPMTPEACHTDPSSSSNHSGSDHALKIVAMEKKKFSTLINISSFVTESTDEAFQDLNKKIVAAESCWFAVRILNEVKDRISCLVGKMGSSSECQALISSYQVIASQLRSLIYKSVCSQIVKYNWIISQIDNGNWDSKKIRDSHHEWVDKIVQTCQEVWDHLNNGGEFTDAALSVREQLWLELCQSCFDAFLDGFSKIRKLTSEGRGIMTMDIAALHDGLDTIHTCRPPRGKSHLNNFIRATHLSEEDTLQWVQENWQMFSYRQLHGLLTLNLSSMLNPKRLKDGIALLDSLYMKESTSWQHTRFADLFDSKNKEDGGIGTLAKLGSRIRRASLTLES